MSNNDIRNLMSSETKADIHTSHSIKKQGLSAGLGAVIGLAVTLLISQPVAAYMGGSFWGTVGAAGVVSASSMATVSLINNQGNIGAAARDLTKQEAFKSIVTAMATAGAT